MIYPEGDKVLVKPDETGRVTKGGIIVPDVVREREEIKGTTGELIAIGPAADIAYKRNGESVQVTDDMLPLRVSFAKYGGYPIHEAAGKDENGRDKVDKYRLMKDKDIVAFLDEGK